MRRMTVLFLTLVACVSTGLDAQLTTPGDWKWRQDAPAPLAKGATMEPGSWVFVQMPPGWHVTTGPGVLLYPTTNGDASGNFSLEADIFLFPGDSREEYGLFLGGQASTTRRTGLLGRRAATGRARRDPAAKRWTDDRAGRLAAARRDRGGQGRAGRGEEQPAVDVDPSPSRSA